MEVYRRANVFERILSLYQSSSIGVEARKKILHIIFRAAQVGGSTTLITRAAIISWIQVQITEADAREAALLSALARTLYELSDHERVDAWGAGSIEQALEEIKRA